MNIYKNLNNMLDFIENNLENEIEYSKLAKILGINEMMLQRFFSILCDISLSEYIRKRRLSNAGVDLLNGKEKIIDVAIKYQYENATSFSRAFENFHGIKPSQVKKNQVKLKVFSKLHFEEQQEQDKNIEYEIIEREGLTLYGVKIETSIEDIKIDAPKFYKEAEQKYGDADYGMTEYIDRFGEEKCYYWVLYNELKDEKLVKYVIPKSKWLSFKINSQKPEEIQKTTKNFYLNFVPSCKYKIKELPELEYYHNNITEFLVPIDMPGQI